MQVLPRFTRPLGLASLLAGLGFVASGCGRPCHDVGFYVVRPDGTSMHRVRPDKDFEDFSDATWVSGGRRLAFMTNGCSWWTMNADGSAVLPSSNPAFGSSGTRLGWTGTGSLEGFE